MPTSESPRRIFSYDEAAALLPDVRRLTEAAHRKLESLQAAVGASGGEGAQEQTGAVVAAWANALAAMGLEVKGLWLVDFDNGSGYYCWRYPEDGLQYYHSYEEGFRGRMRIQ